MNLPFELYVSLRYLVARRKQASMASTSLISVLGVTVGVTALIVALALMTGLQQELRDRIVGSQAHVYVWNVLEGGFADYREAARTLAALPRVEAAAPAIPGRALARSRRGDVFMNVKGIDPELEAAVTELDTSLSSGSLADLSGYDGPALGGIVIGEGGARERGAFVGDEITLLTPSGTLSPMGVLPRPRRLAVVGVFSLGMYQYDAAYGFVTLDAARRLFGKDRVEMMQLRVDDPYASREVADAIPEQLGDAYMTDDWSQLNSTLFEALFLEKMAISVAIGLIVVVATLNIVSSLIMLVMEKSRDIAILKTMGASARTIRRIFVLQGAAIGLAGTAAGAAAGYVICTVMDRYQLLRLPVDVYQVTYVPFIIEPFDFGVVLLAANAVCLFVTLHPSRRAAAIEPAEALRYQ
ncbi:MAG: FtsX-like permease family protein [Chloroflexi bacterium]|nr:FtsX-like permease family protein [Chloroflexota bacterium]